MNHVRTAASGPVLSENQTGHVRTAALGRGPRRTRFLRDGVVGCPVERSSTAPVTGHVGTAALGCPVERSSTASVILSENFVSLREANSQSKDPYKSSLVQLEERLHDNRNHQASSRAEPLSSGEVRDLLCMAFASLRYRSAN